VHNQCGFSDPCDGLQALFTPKVYLNRFPPWAGRFQTGFRYHRCASGPAARRDRAPVRRQSTGPAPCPPCAPRPETA